MEPVKQPVPELQPLPVEESTAQLPYKKIRNFQLLFPSPNQPHYFKGTYEKEVRLNGRGTNGADGTQVYPGMIAAPKTFPFGTKMQIPGIGFVAVHDRGGAIKITVLIFGWEKAKKGFPALSVGVCARLK